MAAEELMVLNGAMGARGWRERLSDAVVASGRSMRSLSLEAGMNANYVLGILREGKDPTLTNLLSLCGVLGVSLNYIVHGHEPNPVAERVLRAFDALTPEQQMALLKNLPGEQQSPPAPQGGTRKSRAPRRPKTKRNQST